MTRIIVEYSYSRSMRLIYAFIFLPNVILSQAAPEIEVSKTIQAFSHDVTIDTRNATVGDVVELFATGQQEPITAQVITKSPETLIFNCGYFFQEGSYFFKIKSAKGNILLTSHFIKATARPKIAISWEKRHEALTTDVKVSMRIDEEICTSPIARQRDLEINLKKISGETRSFPVTKSPENFIPSNFILPCESFHDVGTYEVELVMKSSSDEVAVAKSDVMAVDRSNKYDLKLLKDSFPCRDSGVTVVLSFPPCASDDDSVRLLSVMNGTWEEITTKRRGADDHVTFPCTSFYNINQTIEGFCFQYVVKGGYVAKTICEPVNKKSGFTISGSWSPWGSWSTCKRPCQKSVQQRKRTCNNPRPRGDGNKCSNSEGEESLSELKIQIDEDISLESCTSELMTRTSRSASCECGCSIETEDRGVLVSSLTNNCENSNILIWTVSVPFGHVILFKLSDYQLAQDEFLTIRDGRTSWPMTSQYPTVMSQSNIVIIQWVKSEKDDLKSCGFILSYEALVKPTSDSRYTSAPNTTTTNVRNWFEETVLESPVVLAGIGVCALIIGILVAVVIVHCKRKQKKKPVPLGLRTPMHTRLSMPPDGRSCSNADDTESEPMVRPRPIGNAGSCEVITDSCIPMQPGVGSGTAYYLAQRQLELMRRLGKDEHSQTYATGCMTGENLRQQEDLLFGDRRSLHKNDNLQVT